MKEHFCKELRTLLNTLCAQAAQVEQLIRRAEEAAESGNKAAADAIIAGDSVIDTEEIRIEEEGLKILALYQPVATDLRTVIAYLKINTALERMADFGVHIAERAEALASATTGESIDFSRMSALARQMLRQAMEVLRNNDTVLAHKVLRQDDEVDRLHRGVLDLVRRELSLHPDSAAYYLACSGVSRDLERIADLASDICLHIIYLCTGNIVRHRTAH